VAALVASAIGAIALPSAAGADPNVVNGPPYSIVPTHTSGVIKAPVALLHYRVCR
jgi:hypothetical protein